MISGGGWLVGWDDYLFMSLVLRRYISQLSCVPTLPRSVVDPGRDEAGSETSAEASQGFGSPASTPPRHPNQDTITQILTNMRAYSARALGEEFRLKERSDRDVLAQVQLMQLMTALLTFWMASDPVSRIFLYSKSSCRSRVVVFWLQIFTTSSIQFLGS